MPVYEGPEKRLEIILSSPLPGLRSDTDSRWKSVVNAGRAQIISKISTDFMDAYLLSESSLFVWENRILIITCGKTAPVRALPLLLNIVGKDRVAFLFYEQRNFMISGGHSTDFENDVTDITAWFPGKCFRLGRADHAYVDLFYFSHDTENFQKMPALQILMNDLCADAMQIFCRNGNISASETRSISGLNMLCNPKMIIDDYLFFPCGYSLNGIREKQYLTVHVTPQPTNSYASFETGIMENDWSNIMGKVLAVFRPARFSLILRIGMDAVNFSCCETVESAVQGYLATDKNLYMADCGYKIIFLNYIRQE